MTTLLNSISILLHSSNRRRFILSMIAVALWLAAVTLTFLSASISLLYGDLSITALLAVSSLLAIFSIPSRQSAKVAGNYSEAQKFKQIPQ